MSTTRFHRPGGGTFRTEHKCEKCGDKLGAHPIVDQKRAGLCKCGWENRWYGKRGFCPGEYSKGCSDRKRNKHKEKRQAKQLARPILWHRLMRNPMGIEPEIRAIFDSWEKVSPPVIIAADNGYCFGLWIDQCLKVGLVEETLAQSIKDKVDELKII